MISLIYLFSSIKLPPFRVREVHLILLMLLFTHLDLILLVFFN
jgi:hypothetical protein